MIELYSIRDVARILAVQESRLRYWMQTGFVGPTVRKGGRFYYTFTDLVGGQGGEGLARRGRLAADRAQGRRGPQEGAARRHAPGVEAAAVLRRPDDRRARRRHRVRADRRPDRHGVLALDFRRARRRCPRDSRGPERSEPGSAWRAGSTRLRPKSRTRRPKRMAARRPIATSSRRAPPKIAASHRPPSICFARPSISSRTWPPR